MAKPINKKSKDGNAAPTKAPSKAIVVVNSHAWYKSRYFRTGIVLFFFAFLLYGNTIPNEYAYDDVTVIGMNQLTKQGLKGIPTLFTKSYWFGMTGMNVSYYRPLSLITFALEEAWMGSNPHFSHFNNVLLYAMTGLVLFFCLMKMFRSQDRKPEEIYLISLLTTLFFLTHPVHTEVVANIKSRDEILGFLFSLLALYGMLFYESGKKNIHLILSMFCFWLAVLSKENALMFIGVIPLAFYFFRGLSMKRSLFMGIPALLVAFIYLGMRAHFLDQMMTGEEGAGVIDNALVAAGSVSDKYATIFSILGIYLRLLVFPHPLIYTYAYNQVPIVGWTSPSAILSLLFYACALTYALYMLFKSTRSQTASLLTFSILYFFLTLFLISNLVISIGVTMAERFLYAPSLAFCLLLAFLFMRFTKAAEEKALFRLSKFSIIAWIILLTFSWKTMARNRDWKNNETLFTSDLNHAGKSAVAHRSYEIVVFNKAKQEENPQKKQELIRLAIDEAQKAIDICDVYPDVYGDLGDIYFHLEKFEEAIVNYKKCVLYNKKFPPAYSNLGMIYDRRGQLDSAIWCYEQAIRINPRYWNAHFNMGLTLGKKGNLDAAIEQFLATIKLDAANAVAYSNLGTAYAMKGQVDQAISAYGQALRLNPNDANTCLNLSIAYQSKGDINLSEQYHQRAMQLNPGIK